MNAADSTARIHALERLLVGLLDGVDGFESEHGTLDRFWKTERVEAAREYIRTLPDGGRAAGYWLAPNPPIKPSGTSRRDG
jgi:hypothetical protein